MSTAGRKVISPISHVLKLDTQGMKHDLCGVPTNLESVVEQGDQTMGLGDITSLWTDADEGQAM